MIAQLAPNAADPVNAAAFKEAYKDLLNHARSRHPPASARAVTVSLESCECLRKPDSAGLFKLLKKTESAFKTSE